ncbi:hypothetical protein GCM10011316_11340 [Roseibium aquae]|uniref:ABC-type amino acid transport substrate-binding protein n=1 Tax=Roseibium aquae TaxID=1323746 RepID=A0A916TDR6_9HYPH|nr:transporter substrate-binding domain-containing protein [Roseibium aquae]GGB41122.1 hypothetical protein GCM10011316_11340 [Roseibium aquae]
MQNLLPKIPKYVSILTVSLSTFSGLLPSQAHAEEIVVGVEELTYYPHYSYQNGEYTGFGRTILDAWASDRGHTLTFKAYPVKRLMNALVEGTIDLKYPDNALWSSDLKEGKNVVYSDQVVEYIDGVSVLPQNSGNGVGSVQVLGTVLGFTPFSWLDLINSGTVELSEVNGLDGLIKQAILGRVDAAYANVAVIQHQLAEMSELNALVFDPNLPHTRDYYHLSSAVKPELIADFNDWMADNADRVEQLKREYGVALDDLS